jgi:DNA-binding response OmpR family regulator
MNRLILVVDDDQKTVNLIRLYLEKDGYRTIPAFNGRQALDLAHQRHPDLVILDLMLPEVDGLEVCRSLRSQSNIPIIMLTAKTTEDDKLTGLDLGADDYITKPFSPRELMARVRAVLRRAQEAEPANPQTLCFGDLEINFLHHLVRHKDQAIHLTPTEFRLLATLASQPGRVFSRLDLLEQVLGFDYGGLERTIDVHVMNLRKKIEVDPNEPHYIQTIYGIGYAFIQGDHVG